MPGTLIERPQMTRTVYSALKRHIMRERQKKKQEQEQDEALERLKKERELRKKKEEEDSLNLEQTKEQIMQLTRKMELLKNEKHELFSKLKKVLHQEDESKKKAQLKEQSELMSLAQQYTPNMVPQNMFMQAPMSNRKYLTLHQPGLPPVSQGVKRARSPSPPPATIYTGYSAAGPKYAASSYHSAVKQESYPTPPKQAAYQAQSTHVTYATQSGHTYQGNPTQAQQSTSYPGTQSAASAKYPSGQSAFSSYPSHYAQHPKSLSDHPAYQAAYPVQRVAQSGYLGSLHTGSSLPLQQQLEQANQKSGFSEEKYKLQQHQMAAAGLPPGQQTPVMTSQISMSQHQPPPAAVAPSAAKGSIVTGYPVRSQAVSTAYQASPAVQGRTTSAYSTTQGPRHAYSQPPGRAYY